MDCITAIVAGLGLLSLSSVNAWLGRAIARGDLRPNAALGVRTANTLASLEAWDAAHRSVRSLLVVLAGVGTALGSAALALGVAGLARGTGAGPGVTLGVGGLVLVVLAMVAAGLRADRVARAARPAPRRG